jgi:hypothetical protein
MLITSMEFVYFWTDILFGFDVDSGGLVIALVFKIVLYHSIEWESREGLQSILHLMECRCQKSTSI